MTYIIVIDVCNNRARKAYEKGLSDLSTIWGQLMLFASKKDDEAYSKYEEKHAQWINYAAILKEIDEKAESDYRTAMANYKVKLQEWEETKNSFWGNSRDKPMYPHRYLVYRSPFDNPKPEVPEKLYNKYYESIKKELTNKYNLADAALGPFRMTESDVQTMIAWEDGSRVQKLLDNLVDGGFVLFTPNLFCV